jgi:hydrogenase 3 maturation protease
MSRDLHDLLDQPPGTILFAGVGNVLKRDDGVGVYIAQKIRQGNGIGGLAVEMGIENHIGKINKLAPDVLVIIDACDFGREPGYTGMARASDIMGMTTNTHNISLAKLSELFNMPVYILGIQPADISFGEGMDAKVSETAERITGMINSKTMKFVLTGQK